MISLSTTMRHTCQISSGLNESKDACVLKRLELMCRNQKEARMIPLHRAHGHPHNRTLLLHLEAAGLPHRDKRLKRYLLNISCDAWSCAYASQTLVCSWSCTCASQSVLALECRETNSSHVEQAPPQPASPFFLSWASPQKSFHQVRCR